MFRFRCTCCDKDFDEPYEYTDYLGECFGFPYYEEVSACPYCKETGYVENKEEEEDEE